MNEDNLLMDGFFADNEYISTVATNKYITVPSTPLPVTGWVSDSVVAGISEDDLLAALKKLQKKMTPKMINLNCPSCGAPTSLALTDHILKCQYCRSAYFVGTELTRMVE